MTDFRLGLYRHSKTGGYYTALMLAMHHEHTDVPMVVYTSLHSGNIAVRPLYSQPWDTDGFHDTIKVGGVTTRRFVFIETLPRINASPGFMERVHTDEANMPEGWVRAFTYHNLNTLPPGTFRWVRTRDSNETVAIVQHEDQCPSVFHESIRPEQPRHESLRAAARWADEYVQD